MLTVVMPAHNEEHYLAAAVRDVLDGLGAEDGPPEVLIVENGSTDGTLREARALAAAHEEVRIICHPSPDYGAAIRQGILVADRPWVVIFDVDFVDLTFLADARSEAGRTGAAIVVGTKRGPGSDDQRSLGRRVVTAGFSTLLHFGFGLQVSDTHGVKLLRREAISGLVAACTSRREMFDTELILRAERAGLVVREIPVRATDRRPPRSSIVSRIPRTVSGLLRLRLHLFRHPARP